MDKEETPEAEELEASLLEELESVEDPTSNEEESLDVLFGVLKSVVYNKVQGRSEKLQSVEKSLEALGDAARRIVGEETPLTESDLLAKITTAATEKAIGQITELLQPLISQVENLESACQTPSIDIPERKGMTVVEREKAEAEEKGEVPWWERIREGK